MRKRLENYVNVRRLRAKYHRSSSKKKAQILNEIGDLSGMPRKSIIRVLIVVIALKVILYGALPLPIFIRPGQRIAQYGTKERRVS